MGTGNKYIISRGLNRKVTQGMAPSHVLQFNLGPIPITLNTLCMSSSGGINKLNGVVYCLMYIGKPPHPTVCTPFI